MKALVIALVLSMSGCALLDRQQQEQEPVPQTQQSEVNIGVGYILLAQTREMAADAVKSKLITAEEGRKFLTLTDTVRTTLDKAADAHFNGVEGAGRKALEITDLILNQIKNELLQRSQQRALKGSKP